MTCSSKITANSFQLNLSCLMDSLFLDAECRVDVTVLHLYLTFALLTYDSQSHFLLFAVSPTYQHRSEDNIAK